MSVEFLYFDLGNVLCYFDHHRGSRQMAEVAGVAADAVWQLVFEGPLHLDFEAGRMSPAEFHEAFCNCLKLSGGQRPDFGRLAFAAASIFELNYSLVPIIASLAASGHRLGVLSNTNELHWNYCSDGRYSLIPTAFEILALSYRLGALKPEPAIYAQAIQMTGVPAGRVFFVDDRPENVAGARAAGMDAVLFTGAAGLAKELHVRQIRLCS